MSEFGSRFRLCCERLSWEEESKAASRSRDARVAFGRPAGKPRKKREKGSGGWAQEEGPDAAGRATAGEGGSGALPGTVRFA